MTACHYPPVLQAMSASTLAEEVGLVRPADGSPIDEPFERSPRRCSKHDGRTRQTPWK
jgi:hypothetical protein